MTELDIFSLTFGSAIGVLLLVTVLLLRANKFYVLASLTTEAMVGALFANTFAGILFDLYVRVQDIELRVTNQPGADNIYDFLYQTIGLVVFAIFGLVMMYIGYLSDKSARPRGQETKPAVEPTTPRG